MTRPPPPPPKLAAVFSPDLEPIDREYAVWTFGGYPRIEYHAAEISLMRQCLARGYEWIGAAAIYELEKDLNANEYQQP